MRSRNAPLIVILAAALVVFALLLKTRTVETDTHLGVVATVKTMQELDAKVDQEVLALRYGLEGQYDTIAGLQARIDESAAKLKDMPAILDGDGARAMQADMASLLPLLGRKREDIEAF